MSLDNRNKPRAAFFDFACCEGCQLTVLELDELLFDLLEHVDVVEWREASSSRSNDYDIAFCEGSITRERDAERLRTIRQQADLLVSLGSCASIGCHNALRNQWSPAELADTVYGDTEFSKGLIQAQPVAAVVDVDYQVLGCPLSLPEFVTVFKHMLTGKTYYPPNQPVCVECKLNDNVCVYEKGMVCLGPVTRCGCNSACTNYGDPCHGCRGLIDGANLQAAVKVFSAEELHRIMHQVALSHQYTRDDLRRRFGIYNNQPRIEL